MKNKLYLLVRFVCVLVIMTLSATSSKACNATFTHTYACAGDTVFFYAWDQAAVYTWDFGDSISGAGNISHDTDAYHVFVNPGTYYVTLFVNIGAEWDYRTEILTIGTDCFNAAFSTFCQGSNFIQFTNESTGHYTSSFWDFGDPASGSDDTTSQTNPYHTFSSTGTFTVTLITSDGTQSDTLVQTVTVYTDCLMATIYNNLSGDCVQNVTYMNVAYYTTPTSYLWNYGDPASGALNTSTDSSGMHQYSVPGTYLVTLIISNGVQTDTFYTVEDIIDCNVWPGNTNRDGEVNMEDLFAIGIYYSNVGVPRQGISTSWVGQQSNDWMQSLGFSGVMYLQDLVDMKNADCTGDGVIDMNDVFGIQQNYGARLPNYSHTDRMVPVTTRVTDPTLQVLVGSGSFSAGDTVHLSIDLSATAMPPYVYGLAARLFYDPAFVVPGSVSVTYPTSWMGVLGLDMISLTEDFPIDGFIDFGMVRTDRIQVTGNGPIAQLNFVLRNNISGPMSLTFDPAVQLISNGIWNNNQEIFLPVNTNPGTLITVLAGVNELKNQSVSIYPNPANDFINIQMKNNEMIQSWSIINGLGKICLSGSEKQISTADLASGLYTMKVVTSGGVYSQPFLIR
ncbi:MAG: T9SS type A sorting domain-containing protein [Bacteroidetes bacterium]|nr:T9SS type A sorting domain-containing protein [Bacteroidota bacterium]